MTLEEALPLARIWLRNNHRKKYDHGKECQTCSGQFVPQPTIEDLAELFLLKEAAEAAAASPQASAPHCKGCVSGSLESFEHDGCLTDKTLGKELGRWQKAIYELCRKHAIAPDCIDGGGADSGDPLDFTLSEIGQVICQLENPQDYGGASPGLERTLEDILRRYRETEEAGETLIQEAFDLGLSRHREGRGPKFQVGQRVHWQGQIGDCEGTILEITHPENSGYVLKLDIGEGAEMYQLEANVEPLKPHDYWPEYNKAIGELAALKVFPHRPDLASHGTCRCSDCAVTKRELDMMRGDRDATIQDRDKLREERQHALDECVLRGEDLKAAEDQLATLHNKMATHPLKKYGWNEVPEMCQECDSRDFISSGPKHFVCQHCWILEENEKLSNRAAQLEAAKDAAYSERDNLVCALSKLFPSALERHPDSDATWENDWRWIVFIDLPAGQATWHIHDSELSMFAHLPRFTGRVWDGHTTPQKYLRLAALPAPVAQESTE